jgi:hypothetical protein
MRYQAPYGVSDPNASYVNGNPATGVEGSIPPAAAFEEPQREIVAMISLAGLSPSDGDLQQLAKASQSGGLNYGVDTGTQNAMKVALSPTLAGGTYFPGLYARVKVLHANINDTTHTTLTLDAGCGPAPVVRPDGSFPLSGDIPAGSITEFAFDGTRWQIVNFLGQGGAGGGTNNTFLVKLPYCVDTSSSPNTILANFSPAITALNAGDAVLVKVANTNTAATQISVNALSPKAVVRNDGQLTPLQLSDITGGSILMLVFDGVQFLVVSGGSSFPTPHAIVPIYSTQNWTVPNGIYRVRARVWGGGGGGNGTVPGRQASAGGGGGGYSERICQVSPGLVIAVTVGAGGAGGAWGSNTAPGAGGSAFGGFCSATGGGGGKDDTYTPGGPIGGTPGVGSGGDLNFYGEWGHAPVNATVPNQAGGSGGSGGFGGGYGGGGNTGLATGSETAEVPGGGGEGAGTYAPSIGAYGAPGLVLIEY